MYINPSLISLRLDIAEGLPIMSEKHKITYSIDPSSMFAVKFSEEPPQ